MYQSYMTIQVINYSANLIQLYNEIPIPNYLGGVFYYYLYTSQGKPLLTPGLCGNCEPVALLVS